MSDTTGLNSYSNVCNLKKQILQQDSLIKKRTIYGRIIIAVLEKTGKFIILKTIAYAEIK